MIVSVNLSKTALALIKASPNTHGRNVGKYLVATSLRPEVEVIRGSSNAISVLREAMLGAYRLFLDPY